MAKKDFTAEKSVFVKERLGVGVENPALTIDTSGKTDGIVSPAGTTAQRVGTIRGTFRYNTTINEFEGYNGTEWYNIAGRAVNAARLGGNTPDFYSSVKYVDDTKDWLIQFVADSTAGVSSIGGVNGAISVPQLWGIIGVIPQANLPTRLQGLVTTTAEGTMSAADKVKLNAIATGATKNDTDANLRDRTTHTGTIPNTVVTGLGILSTRNTITSDFIDVSGYTTSFVLGRTTSGGAQMSPILLSEAASASSIAYRGTGGTLRVGAPTASDHATTLQWVSSQLSLKANLDTATPTVNGLMSAADKAKLDTLNGTYATKSELTAGLNTKFNNPTGTNAQYISGNGTLVAFPAPTIINSMQGTIVIDGASGNVTTTSGNRIIISSTVAGLDPITSLPAGTQVKLYSGGSVYAADTNVFASAADGALARSAIQPATLTANMNTKLSLTGGSLSGSLTMQGSSIILKNGNRGAQSAMLAIGAANDGISTTWLYRQTDNSITFDMYNAGSGAWERTVLRIGHSGGVTVSGGLHNNGGDITCSGNVGAFSDIRLKDNIKTIDNALDLFTSFRGTTYVKDGTLQYGVIAQEVEKVTPELVKESSEVDDIFAAKGERPTLYVNADNSFMAIAIEAMKEMKEKIEKLEAKIEALQK